MTANLPISSSVIANSITCRHPATMPFLVRSIPNGESTNKSPVPCLLVSWNRSSSGSSGYIGWPAPRCPKLAAVGSRLEEAHLLQHFCVLHFRSRRYRATATPILQAGESVGFDGDHSSMWIAGSGGFMRRKPLLRPRQVSSGRSFHYNG